MASCWFEVLLSFRSTGTNLRRQQTPSLRTDGSKPVLLSHLLYACLLSYYNIGEHVSTLCIGETVCSVGHAQVELYEVLTVCLNKVQDKSKKLAKR